MLACAGYRTGLYTSPHLQRINERIQISGVEAGRNTLLPISDDRLAELFTEVEAAAKRLVEAGELPHPPSFFETLTAMAFLAFREQQIDIAVLEVGLGGRLDATNIVEPVLSVITDIALDHTEWLGETLGEIAREKAGILRPQGHVVILPQHPEVNAAVGEVAMQLGVTGINAADFLPAQTPASGSREMGGATTSAGSAAASAGPVPTGLSTPLAGQHQQRNSALAIAAANYLHKNERFARLDDAAVRSGLAQVRWPGRLEHVLLPSGVRVLMDVAHNPAGTWTLRSYLSAAFAAGDLPEPRMLLFSAYRDKAIGEMAQILFPLFEEPGDSVCVVAMDGPRAASLEELQAAAAAVEITARTAASAQEALRYAAAAGFASVVITGSVHLIGDAKDAIYALVAADATGRAAPNDTTDTDAATQHRLTSLQA